MTDDQARDAALAGMEFLEAMGQILDLLDGYRAKLIEHGYSPAAAEQMTVHMHENMMISIREQSAGKSK